MRLDVKKKQILKDFIINIIAAVIPIALLQVVIFPQLAEIKGDEIYGFIVTIISIMTLFSDSYGNVLNNVRLLQDEEYKEKGDFNFILLIGVIFNIVVVYIGYNYYGLRNEGIVGILVASVLILVRAYYIVGFRLVLSYKNILINNIFLAIGYLLGFEVFLKFGNWTVIYSCGNVVSLVHLFFSSQLMRESLRRTPLFKKTFKKFLILYIAFFLKTFITYADKLLIFPILGAEAVAYYYAASVMGKMMSMAISPISSVILSYVVKAKTISKEMINRILMLIIVISSVGFILAYVFGRILLKLLYNSWFDITVGLLPWTVLAAVLGGVASIIQPFILRFKSEVYQIIVNIIYILVYISISLLLTRLYGLTGFCIGYSITILIKLLVDLVLLRSIIIPKDKHRFVDILPHTSAVIDVNDNVWKKKLQYASMGRFGIYHILKSIDINSLKNHYVMIPVYACSSIPFAVRKAGFVPVYYDITPEDLNGDIESIIELHSQTNSSILILPSLYGNPADLETVQNFCQKENIYLIDDAAQAFGTFINNKMVGTFGNAGLFSFSSGKPTLGHMGCYFWCENEEYHITRTKHNFYHKIAYYNFFYNRCADYNSKKIFRFKLFEYLRLALYKIIDISNDDIGDFEVDLLASIYDVNLKVLREKRVDFFKSIVENWRDPSFRIVTPLRGKSNNNKIVIVAINSDRAHKLQNFLKIRNIRVTSGYRLLDSQKKYPIANDLSERIVEIHYSTSCECLEKIRCACQEWNLKYVDQ